MAMNVELKDFEYLKNATLGERLLFFRQRMIQHHGIDKYTIKELSSRLRITPQTISAIERGMSKNPSFLIVQKLAHEYGVTLDSLTDEFYKDEED